METVADFILGGSKISANGDCSHEIQRRFLLGRKVMTNLDSILESGHITLPTKVSIVKTVVSSVVVSGCESWTIKKPEGWIIDAFELWCWRRLLDCKKIQPVPWTARSLKEISPEYSLEGLVLKLSSSTLATWCEELTHWKRPWCWERLREGEEGATEDEMVGRNHWLNRHEFEQALEDDEGQGSLACCSPWGSKNWTQLSNWTTTASQYKVKGFLKWGR